MVVRVTITLPDELLGKLDSIAAEESLTRSDVVREAASSYVSGKDRAKEVAARGQGVADGLAWLASVARAPEPGEASVLEVLRELRGDAPDAGQPIAEDAR